MSKKLIIKTIEKIEKDLSNNNKIINKKIDSIKKEISSSSGNTSNSHSVDNEETYPDKPFLETEEEAAENIADISDRRDVRKRDNKARTSAPPDNTEEAAENMVDINEKNLNDVNNLIDNIYIYSSDSVYLGQNGYIRFNDLLRFLNDIKNGRINNSNIKKVYQDRIKKIEIKLMNTERMSDNINKYKKYINDLKDILFRRNTSKKEKENNKDSNKKSSGKGLTSSLPIISYLFCLN